MGKLLAKNLGRVAFEPVDDLAYRERGRSGYEQVKVVGLDGKVLHLHSYICGLLAEQLFEPVSHTSDKNLSPPPGYPNEVVLERNHGAFVVYIGVSTVASHTSQ